MYILIYINVYTHLSKEMSGSPGYGYEALRDTLPDDLNNMNKKQSSVGNVVLSKPKRYVSEEQKIRNNARARERRKMKLDKKIIE
jgi:hypothetical protein